MRFLFAAIIIFSVSAQSVFAQADSGSFAIKVFGGEDTEAPSTPTLLTATPVATTQIDLTWSPSTDNFVVSGYVVYEDGVAIATTTQTSYSALGLIASTTYTFFVRAFDPSFNYSSSSNSLATTTLDNPPPPPPPTPNESGGTTATAARVVLDELVITPGISTSTFYIKTARPARFELRWGRTTSYELGYIVHDHFVDEYETTLTDLEPNTVYEYEIVGYTPFGKATTLKRGQFSTKAFSDIYPPANVNRFMGVAEGNDVRLSWQLPYNESYQFVRVVRSHLGFPTHLQDGAIVYQGSGESVIDRGILTQYSPVYYSAFVVDGAGNVSSGAVAKVYALGEGGGIAPPVPGGAPSAPSDTPRQPAPPVVASTSPSLPKETRMPDLSEIFLIQQHDRYTFATEEVLLDSTTAFVVSIPKHAVSESLKTIVATVYDPTNAKQASSFLLRLNKDKSAYEAVVGALNVEGMSRIKVDIYDYSSAVVGTFEKTIIFKKTRPDGVEPILNGLSVGELLTLIGLFVLPLLLVLLLFIFFYRKKH